MMNWLVTTGFRFDRPEEERAFCQDFILSRRVELQFFMVLGSLIFYTFFVWDQIIDAENATITHAIRGLIVSPLILALTAALSVASWRPHMEALLLVAISVTSMSLPVIYTVLRSGFDHGAVGVVLVGLFAFTLLPIRLSYFVAFSALSWGTFIGLQLRSGNAQPGMLLVNNMSIGTAMVIGLFGAGAREHAARRQFRTAQELDRAKARVDDLLHSMLPREIVRRIQAGETGIADAHGEVSIVFADLVGFTELSRRISARALVEVLDRLFSKFDLEAERHGIEKIKTIGDAYMAVAGISPSDHDHAERAAAFALALQRAVTAVSAELDIPINIRVGLHVGPVVAGVIGTKRPAFDCWGEAVNVASRLEHRAMPGGVLVSESAYWRLRKRFPMTTLDDVDLKGIGPAKVFLLHDHAEEEGARGPLLN